MKAFFTRTYLMWQEIDCEPREKERGWGDVLLRDYNIKDEEEGDIPSHLLCYRCLCICQHNSHSRSRKPGHLIGTSILIRKERMPRVSM